MTTNTDHRAQATSHGLQTADHRLQTSDCWRRTLLLRLALLLCLVGGGAGAAWGQGNKRVLISQNYETGSSALDWAAQNVTPAVQSNSTSTALYGSYYVNIPQGGGSGNRSCYKQVGSYSVGTGYTTSTLTTTGYNIEFDFQMISGDNAASTPQLIVRTDDPKTTNNNKYEGSSYIFSLSSSGANSTTFYVNDLNNASNSVTLTSGYWYHVKLVISSGNVAYTLSQNSTSAIAATQLKTGNKTVTGMPTIGGIFALLGRANSYLYFDNFEIYDYSASYVAPTFTLTNVNGSGMTYSISNTNGGGSTLFYTTSLANSAPEKGNGAYSSTTNATTTITVSGTGNLYAYVGNGAVTSDITVQAVAPITLNAPTIVLSGMEADGDVYHPTFSATSSNAGIALAPTITQTATFTPSGGVAKDVELPFTATEKGDLTVTASASGYTSAVSNYTVNYPCYKITDCIDLSSEYIDVSSFGTGTVGRWANFTSMSATIYGLPSTTALPGITLNANSNTQFALGYGLGINSGARTITIDSSIFGTDEIAEFRKYISGSLTTFGSEYLEYGKGAWTIPLTSTSQALKLINIYTPTSYFDTTSGGGTPTTYDFSSVTTYTVPDLKNADGTAYTGAVSYTSSNASVANTNGTTFWPVGDGTATITETNTGAKLTITVSSGTATGAVNSSTNTYSLTAKGLLPATSVTTLAGLSSFEFGNGSGVRVVTKDGDKYYLKILNPDIANSYLPTPIADGTQPTAGTFFKFTTTQKGKLTVTGKNLSTAVLYNVDGAASRGQGQSRRAMAAVGNVTKTATQLSTDDELESDATYYLFAPDAAIELNSVEYDLPIFQWSQASKTIDITDVLQSNPNTVAGLPSLSNTYSGTVKYESSNKEVAVINETSGQIYIIGTGTTTIKASIEAEGVEAAYTLNISGTEATASKTSADDYEEWTVSGTGVLTGANRTVNLKGLAMTFGLSTETAVVVSDGGTSVVKVIDANGWSHPLLAGNVPSEVDFGGTFYKFVTTAGGTLRVTGKMSSPVIFDSDGGAVTASNTATELTATLAAGKTYYLYNSADPRGMLNSVRYAPTMITPDNPEKIVIKDLLLKSGLDGTQMARKIPRWKLSVPANDAPVTVTDANDCIKLISGGGGDATYAGKRGEIDFRPDVPAGQEDNVIITSVRVKFKDYSASHNVNINGEAKNPGNASHVDAEGYVSVSSSEITDAYRHYVRIRCGSGTVNIYSRISEVIISYKYLEGTLFNTSKGVVSLAAYDPAEKLMEVDGTYTPTSVPTFTTTSDGNAAYTDPAGFAGTLTTTTDDSSIATWDGTKLTQVVDGETYLTTSFAGTDYFEAASSQLHVYTLQDKANTTIDVAKLLFLPSDDTKADGGQMDRTIPRFTMTLTGAEALTYGTDGKLMMRKSGGDLGQIHIEPRYTGSTKLQFTKVGVSVAGMDAAADALTVNGVAPDETIADGTATYTFTLTGDALKDALDIKYAGTGANGFQITNITLYYETPDGSNIVGALNTAKGTVTLAAGSLRVSRNSTRKVSVWSTEPQQFDLTGLLSLSNNESSYFTTDNAAQTIKGAAPGTGMLTATFTGSDYFASATVDATVTVINQQCWDFTQWDDTDVAREGATSLWRSGETRSDGNWYNDWRANESYVGGYSQLGMRQTAEIEPNFANTQGLKFYGTIRLIINPKTGERTGYTQFFPNAYVLIPVEEGDKVNINMNYSSGLWTSPTMTNVSGAVIDKNTMQNQTPLDTYTLSFVADGTGYVKILNPNTQYLYIKHIHIDKFYFEEYAPIKDGSIADTYTQTVRGAYNTPVYSVTQTIGDITSASIDSSTGELTINGSGVVVVQATDGSDSDAETAQYVLTVSYPGEHYWSFYNIGDLNVTGGTPTAENYTSPCSSPYWGNYTINSGSNGTLGDYDDGFLHRRVNEVQGDYALLIPSTAGLVFHAAPGRVGVKSQGTLKSEHYVAWYDQATLTIPYLKKGQYIKFHWNRQNENSGRYIQIMTDNLEDVAYPTAKAYPQGTIMGVGNTRFGYGDRLVGTTIFHVTKDGSVTFKLKDGWNLLWDVFVSEPDEWPGSDLRLVVRQKNGGNSTLEDYRVGSGFKVRVAPRVMANDTGSDIELYYDGTVNDNHQNGNYNLYTLLEGSGTIEYAGAGENQITIRNDHGGTFKWGYLRVVQNTRGTFQILQQTYDNYGEHTEPSELVANNFVIDRALQFIRIKVPAYTQQEYPYTWNFTKITEKSANDIDEDDDANEGNGWKPLPYGTDGATPTTEQIQAEFMNDATSNDGYYGIHTEYHLQGGDMLANGETIIETEGLGIKTYPADDYTNNVVQLSDKGTGLRFANHNSAKQEMIIPKVNGDMAIYIRLKKQQTTSALVNDAYLGYSVMELTKDGETYTNKESGTVLKAETRIDNTTPFYEDAEEKVFLIDLPSLDISGLSRENQAFCHVHLWARDILFKQIGVTNIRKTMHPVGGVGWATESRERPIDHSLTGYFTQNDANAYVAAYGNYDLNKATVTLSPVSEDGYVPSGVGVVLKQDVTTTTDSYNVPLFVPAITTAETTTRTAYAPGGNMMYPNVQERRHSSETQGTDGDESATNYTKFVLTNVHWTYRAEDTLDADEAATAITETDAAGFYRLHIWETTDDKDTRNTMAANSAYLLVPTAELPTAVWAEQGRTGGVRQGTIAIVDAIVDVADGDATAVGTPRTADAPDAQASGAVGWYTLSGTKLAAKPTKPGLYLHRGRKVAVRR